MKVKNSKILIPTLIFSLTIALSGIATGAPTANFTAEPTTGVRPLTVQFDATGSTAPENVTIEEYKWDFEGDGQIDEEGITVDNTYRQSGTYTAELTVVDSEGQEDKAQKTIEVKDIEPELEIYIPKQNEEKEVNEEFTVEAGAVKRGDFVDGEFTAEITGIETELEKRDIGTYRGKIKANETGEKTLTVKFQGEQHEIEKERNIKVINKTEAEEKIKERDRLEIIYPEHETRIAINETRYIMVSLRGIDDKIIYGEEIDYEILYYDEIVETGKIEQRDRLYVTSHTFKEPGEYTIKVSWEDKEHSIKLDIGHPDEIPDERKLKTDIITPRPVHYSAGSEIRIIAATQKEQEYTHEPNVTYRLGTGEWKELQESERVGEWEGNLGKPDEGRHTLTVRAKLDEEVAIDSIEFIVTENYLEINPIKPEPGEEIEVEEGRPMEIEVEVQDQNEILVEDAVVEATITDPEGKKSQETLLPEPEEKIYRTEYYPEKTGEYEIEIEASKPDHLPDTKTMNFHVETGEEGIIERIIPEEMDFRTVLTIALIIAIIILILAIVHPLRLIAG